MTAAEAVVLEVMRGSVGGQGQQQQQFEWFYNRQDRVRDQLWGFNTIKK